MNPARLKAYFYLTFVVIIWGIAGPVIKFTLGEVPWDLVILYRFLISTVLFLPFIKPSSFRPLKKPGIMLIALAYALTNMTIGLSLLFAGTARTSLVSMSLLSLFGPVLTILGGYFFLKDKITWIEKLGVVITFIGSFLIIIEPVLKFDGIQGELTGNLLVLGSLVSGSVAAILLKILLRKGVSASMLSNLNFVIGFFTMIPVALHYHSASQIFETTKAMTLPYHAGIWYLAIFSGTIAYYLNNEAQKSIEVSEQAVFSYIFPIISAILAVWILKEPMNPLSYFGAGVTIVGIIVAETKRRSKKPQSINNHKKR